MTKLHEEYLRGTLPELADWASQTPKGEVVVVVEGAPPADEADDARVRATVAEAIGRGASTRDAATEVARLLGVSRRRAYRLALEV